MNSTVGLGSDPMDVFSGIIGSETTPLGLGVIYKSPVRALEEKPGRSLIVLHDKRVPHMYFINPAYSYVNILWNADNLAGNHYHKAKQEIFTVLTGSFLVYLKSLDGKRTEKIRLKAPAEGDITMERLYIPVNIAHCIQACESPSIIHVLATSPNTLSDEFPFDVCK